MQFSGNYSSQFLNFDVPYRHISEVLDKTFWKDKYTSLQQFDQAIACIYIRAAADPCQYSCHWFWKIKKLLEASLQQVLPH